MIAEPLLGGDRIYLDKDDQLELFPTILDMKKIWQKEVERCGEKLDPKGLHHSHLSVWFRQIQRDELVFKKPKFGKSCFFPQGLHVHPIEWQQDSEDEIEEISSTSEEDVKGLVTKNEFCQILMFFSRER